MDLLGQLTRIGFTDEEARVYLALLREYPVTSYQIAKETEAQRSHTQDILSRLLSRGIVLETLEGRTTLYRPLPPLMLLAQHDAEHSRLLAVMRTSLDEVYQDTHDDRVWSIEGRVPVLTYAAKMIQYAETGVSLILNDRDVKSMRPEIDGAGARDLILNALLTGEEELSSGRVGHYSSQHGDAADLHQTMLVSVEGGETIISSNSPLEQMRATVTRNKDIGNIARQLVQMALLP